MAILESGHYDRAQHAFSDALKLDSSDPIATQGLLLSELFMEFEDADWDPSIGWLVLENLEGLGLDERFENTVRKYRADVEYGTGNIRAARDLYDQALNDSNDYVDALLADGWAAYSESPAVDIDGMIERFEGAISAAHYDYRGYHGYGYALHMKAVGLDAFSAERDENLSLAAQQSLRAADFQFSHLNVVADFGEIARAVAPSLSLYFHERALSILEDTELMGLPENRLPMHRPDPRARGPERTKPLKP